MNIKEYWKAITNQEALSLKEYFHPSAYVRWHNTNEQFAVDEFIRATCEYPNKWGGEIERIEQIDDLIVCVVHVFTLDQSLSFHVASFIKTKKDKIISIDEYWGDDCMPPQWRVDKNIGALIL